VDYRFRPPTRRPEDNGAPPPRYRRDTADGMIIERDVAVPVRGGVPVYADVFRPADEQPAPPLIAWSPYGKHAGSQVTERYPDGGVAPGQLSGYAAFESPDPLYWTARGYAVINADIPGPGTRAATPPSSRPRRPHAGTILSSGPRPSRGATARSACPACPT
jgi:predicted acyl esterase